MKFKLFFSFFLYSFLASATSFKASVDRIEISQDESVSLKFIIEADSANPSVDDLRYFAPEFDELNSYQSTSIQSIYQNGKFEVQNQISVTKVLRPQKKGKFKISKMSVNVDGKRYTTNDLFVEVTASGGGTPPDQRYQSRGTGLNAQKKTSRKSVFLKAEVNRSEVFKGEQMIVSYYLYRSVRVLDINVLKYPTLKGFLREDMEMPVLTNRHQWEAIQYEGNSYYRTLLVRYAAYPVKEGTLRIDPLSVKVSYFPTSARDRGGRLSNDPFMNFFNQLSPQISTKRSSFVNVNVLPLPSDGKPPSYRGGVGDFELDVAVDRYDLRVNDTLNVVVKVEGRGNATSIDEPNISWPSSFEIYESTSQAKTNSGGVSEKIFKYLVIPRSGGEFTLPEIEMAFFDPIQKKYYLKKSSPISIHVEGPVQDSKENFKKQESNEDSISKEDNKNLPPVLTDDSFTARESFLSLENLLLFLVFIVFLVLGLWVLMDTSQVLIRGKKNWSKKRKEAWARSWKGIRSQAQSAVRSHNFDQISKIYEKANLQLLDAIGEVTQVSTRAIPRSEIKKALQRDASWTEDQWEKVDQLFEEFEVNRYSGRSLSIEELGARLMKWISRAEEFCEKMIDSK